MENTPTKQPRSAAAIIGLVIGVLALLTSLLPIINNISFFFAIIGAIFAVVGLVGCLRGKRGGKGLAFVAIAVNVIAVVAVLASQSMYSSAIDDAVNGPQAVTSSEAGEGAQDKKAKKDVTGLVVGSSVELDNGLTVSVDSVTPGLTNYDGSLLTGVRVTYTNNGEETAPFNSYDWKGENADGARSDATYYSEASEELSYGDLAAGGTVSGDIYFEGDVTSVLYFSSMIADDPAASWKIA